jgi:hypothetical protein
MLLTNVLAYGHRGGELLHPRTLSSLTQSSDFILAGEKKLLQAALPTLPANYAALSQIIELKREKQFNLTNKLKAPQNHHSKRKQTASRDEMIDCLWCAHMVQRQENKRDGMGMGMG